MLYIYAIYGSTESNQCDCFKIIYKRVFLVKGMILH